MPSKDSPCGVNPPTGMVLVTSDQFFSDLKSDPRDIMPSNEHPEYTLWMDKSRRVWGWSYPGWKNSGFGPKVYAHYPTSSLEGETA